MSKFIDTCKNKTFSTSQKKNPPPSKSFWWSINEKSIPKNKTLTSNSNIKIRVPDKDKKSLV